MKSDAQQYRMTVSEAAQYLDLPVRQIYRKVATGELDHLRTYDAMTTRVVNGEAKTVRVSGRLRFSQAGLDAWIDAHRSPVRAAAHPMSPSVARELPMPALRRFAR
jgi:hypothetical protein